MFSFFLYISLSFFISFSLFSEANQPINSTLFLLNPANPHRLWKEKPVTHQPQPTSKVTHSTTTATATNATVTTTNTHNRNPNHQNHNQTHNCITTTSRENKNKNTNPRWNQKAIKMHTTTATHDAQLAPQPRQTHNHTNQQTHRSQPHKPILLAAMTNPI